TVSAKGLRRKRPSWTAGTSACNNPTPNRSVRENPSPLLQLLPIIVDEGRVSPAAGGIDATQRPRTAHPRGDRTAPGRRRSRVRGTGGAHRSLHASGAPHPVGVDRVLRRPGDDHAV